MSLRIPDSIEKNELNGVFISNFQELFLGNEETFFDLNGTHKKLKDELVFDTCSKILSNTALRNKIKEIILYNREANNTKIAPESIKEGYALIRLAVSNCLLAVALFSKTFSQNQINNLQKNLHWNIRSIKESIGDCTLVEVTYCLSNAFLFKEFRLDLPYLKPEMFEKIILVSGRIRPLWFYFMQGIEIPALLGDVLVKISERKAAGEQSLARMINEICKALRRNNYFNSNCQAYSDDDIAPFSFYFKQREFTKVVTLLHKLLDEFSEVTDDNFSVKCSHLMDKSLEMHGEIKKVFFESYKVFPNYKGNIHVDDQWGNKVFLNTLKLLSTLNVISASNDDVWKKGVFIRNFHVWFDELHDGINFHFLKDDWDEIYSLLKDGENDAIEYKSTFGFPIQGTNNSLKDIKDSVRSIEEKIAETILAMANSGGGTIVVGIVEYPERVSDTAIREKIFERSKRYFIDINYSLGREGVNLDAKIQKIQTLLRAKTGERIDFLDELFTMRTKEILSATGRHRTSIVLISVKQGTRLFFLKKEDKWITLPKRLHGRVECVNPETEFRRPAVAHE